MDSRENEFHQLSPRERRHSTKPNKRHFDLSMTDYTGCRTLVVVHYTVEIIHGLPVWVVVDIGKKIHVHPILVFVDTVESNCVHRVMELEDTPTHALEDKDVAQRALVAVSAQDIWRHREYC